MMKKTKPCHCCDGSGRELDDTVVGAQMRKLRQKAGFNLKTLADRMGVDISYLSLLELGRRGWSEQLIRQYNNHCK